MAPERPAPSDSAGPRHIRAAGEPKRHVAQRGAPPRDVRAAETDVVCSRLGSAQQGAVKRAQLLAAGVGENAVKRRARKGQLHRRYRGVYIVGHLALAPRAEEFAALLACGDRALVSHRSAAYLWSMLADRPDQIDVTLVGSRRRPKPGIRLHLVSAIDGRDVRPIDDLPVTAPARTLIDFAADAEDDELEAAVSEARALRRIRDGDLEAALARAGNRRGVARMRRLISRESDSGYTRSKAERHMRRLMRDAALAQPRCNRRLHGYRVDFLWSEQRLIVEVDGYQFHGHRYAFERDRKRDAAHVLAGYRVIRITWRQLTEEPMAVAVIIARALERGAL
jgi:very-short-patch-repair endonuclease